MPAYKRQHFLPCVYLKNFSPERAKATRDSKVWRIDSRRTLSVSVKSQCAGDYLFSKTAADKSEGEFQAIEQAYATAVARIWEGGDPTVFEYFALVVAILDLYARNISHENCTGSDGAHAYRLRTISLLDRLIAGNRSREALPQEEAFARLKEFWSVRLFLTPPGREIVTSDQPVLCFNWGESDDMDFLLMPVTPGVCAAVFDKRTTQIHGHRLTESDGTHLFQLTAMHAHSCIYTTSEPTPEVINAFRRLWQRRFNPRTITDREKWALDLILPPRPDVFTFIRPHRGG